jgi:hypothetical protein
MDRHTAVDYAKAFKELSRWSLGRLLRGIAGCLRLAWPLWKDGASAFKARFARRPVQHRGVAMAIWIVWRAVGGT